MGGTEHVARMGQRKCLRVLDGMISREVSWTDLGQESVHMRAVVSAAMNCEAFTKQVLS